MPLGNGFSGMFESTRTSLEIYFSSKNSLTVTAAFSESTTRYFKVFASETLTANSYFSFIGLTSSCSRPRYPLQRLLSSLRVYCILASSALMSFCYSISLNSNSFSRSYLSTAAIFSWYWDSSFLISVDWFYRSVSSTSFLPIYSSNTLTCF